MMACIHDEEVKCFIPKPLEGMGNVSTTAAPPHGPDHVDTCGSNVAYPYFVSFIVLCSFLVIISPLVSEVVELPNSNIFSSVDC